MKTKVHIIAHTHWDREWYLPYEAHNMRLVELMDALLDIFETDSEFHSFHLDGQTIGLDDYLAVRPDKRGILHQHVQSGKLKIGPFYILQDAFLTSSESNVRNALVGFDESKAWGTPVQLGYFPDTFGLPAQIPQMMKQMNLDTTAYGRGVRALGFAPKGVVQGLQSTQGAIDDASTANVDARYTSPYSEMKWVGADGTETLGVLFANWYSNGNEIPVDKSEAQLFWDTKLADAKRYASTRHLLMMNGCDHQPLQRDLTAAIHTARELYPDIEFVHTDFDSYMAELRAELPADLTTVSGELKSQETEGWYTLANCASSRIYLKQWNTRVARQLENIAEPLATMAYDTADTYPHAQLRYAWKKYMQNHPHDSICGCSVDDVHAGMVTRFKDAYEVGKYVAIEAGQKLVSQIDTTCFPTDSKPFVVFNTAGSQRTTRVDVELELERIPFATAWPPVGFKELSDKGFGHYQVIDSQGKSIPFELVEQVVKFGADLPKDQFRQPFMGRFVTLRLLVSDMPAMSWASYALVETDTPPPASKPVDCLENQFLKVDITSQGTLSVHHKETGKTYTDLLVFENVGDVGNEYIFKQPNGTTPIYSTAFETRVSDLIQTPTATTATLSTTMMIPCSAEDTLLGEQMAMYEFRQRQSKRHEQLIPLTLTTKLTLVQGSRQLKFETSFDNQARDHRLRVLFPTDIVSDSHVADSIYETVTRPNGVSSSWTNPTNPQHQQAFSGIYDAEQGVTVANFGLNEYELLQERGTLAITLHRGTGELGDWGYFPTPEAQCLGPISVAYAIAFHEGGEISRLRSYHDAKSDQIPLSVFQTHIHSGERPTNHVYLQLAGLGYALTALKRKEHSHELITRGYNLTTTPQPYGLAIDDYDPVPANLLETPTGECFNTTLRPAEIVTHLWTT